MAGFFKGLLRPFKDCPEFKEFRTGKEDLAEKRPKDAIKIIALKTSSLSPNNQQTSALEYDTTTYKTVWLFIKDHNKYVLFKIKKKKDNANAYNVKFTKTVNGTKSVHECVVDSEKIIKLISQGLWHIPNNCHDLFENFRNGTIPSKWVDLPENTQKILSLSDLKKKCTDKLPYNAYMKLSTSTKYVTFTILSKNPNMYTLIYNNKICVVDDEKLIESMIAEGLWIGDVNVTDAYYSTDGLTYSYRDLEYLLDNVNKYTIMTRGSIDKSQQITSTAPFSNDTPIDVFIKANTDIYNKTGKIANGADEFVKGSIMKTNKNGMNVYNITISGFKKDSSILFEVTDREMDFLLLRFFYTYRVLNVKQPHNAIPPQAMPAQAMPAQILSKYEIPLKTDTQWWNDVKNIYGNAGVVLADLLVDYTTNPQFPRSKRELKIISNFFSKFLHPNKGGDGEEFKKFRAAYEYLEDKDKLADKVLNDIYTPKMKDKQPGTAGGKRHIRCNTHRGKKASNRTHRKKYTQRKQRK